MNDSMEKRYVVLVDENDNEIGVMEKLEAHQKGSLHRAFSVFIFNQKGEMLLQQRALNKYHSAGLWSNACCSHPSPGENTRTAAINRLQQEMGLSCDLKKKYSFIYKVTFENGLCEYELDHVFTGKSDAVPVPDNREVMNFQWKTLKDIHRSIADTPLMYTEWFLICMKSHPGFASDTTEF